MAKKTSFRSRAGFIYAAQSEEGWVKVGFTRLLPHRRVQDLSNTSARQSFKLLEAKYTHDVIISEKRVHEALISLGVKKEKEFFLLSGTEINIREQLEKAVIKDKMFTSTDHQLDFRDIRESGQSILEKMSVHGDAYASFCVAERLVEKKKWGEAVVMFGVSCDQGFSDSRLYQNFILSFLHNEKIKEHLEELLPYARSAHTGYHVSEEVIRLLEIEQSTWKDHPDRATLWASIWNQSPAKNPRA